jgi:DNA-directed RNA polymerase subunit RPC12/RpoP
LSVFDSPVGKVVRVPGMILLIPRGELENPSAIDRLKGQVESAAILSVKIRRKYLIALTISGYDRDPRELFEIPEVCNWARSVFERIPSLYYFLTVDSQWRFVGWLCGPIHKSEIESTAFQSRFDQQRLSCIVRSIVHGDEMLILQGADRHLVDEIRNYDLERTKLSREIPVSVFRPGPSLRIPRRRVSDGTPVRATGRSSTGRSMYDCKRCGTRLMWSGDEGYWVCSTCGSRVKIL